MKVVMCQNCGAKYQLDDTDDINAFECSVCAGGLEEIESFPDNRSSESFDYGSYDLDPNSVLVYCTDCGLKYQLDRDDDIADFECTSCGGPLDYVTDSNQISNQTEDVFYDNGYQGDDYYQDEELIEESTGNLDENPIQIEEEIVPVHAETDYYEEGIVPAHAEETYLEDEILPAQTENNNYFFEEDIVPIHAESAYGEDIVPIHADSSYDSEDIVPIHAESDYEYSYSTQSPDEVYEIRDENILPAEGGFSGIDEIIPIHAENRQRNISPNISAGFSYNNFSPSAETQVVEEEPKLVDISNMPEDLSNIDSQGLNRQSLSEEDKARFERDKNRLVFDSTEEYEAYKLARFRYYSAIMDILKDEYLKGIDDELYGKNSVGRLIRKGNDSIKNINLSSDESKSLVSPEMTKVMVTSQEVYEPKKSYADILVIVGLFLAVVGIAYYFTVYQLIYILAIIAIGIIILIVGIYQRYRFKDYVTRGRIIREKLLTLPPIFHVFYAVQPPGARDIINHVVVGPTGMFTILSKRYDSREYKDKMKSDEETDGMVNDSASIQDYINKKHTLELQDGYDDNQTRFQFGNEEIHFVHNSRIKRKALALNEDLAIFLDKNGLSGIYIEPLLGFINDDLAVLNVILTNEDLFMDELFHKMIYGQRRLDELTVDKIALLLSRYSADCSD